MVLLHKILFCAETWSEIDFWKQSTRCSICHWWGGDASWSFQVLLSKHYHHMLFSLIKNIFAVGVLLTKNICTVLGGWAEASSPVSCASISKRTHETGWTVWRKPEYVDSNETLTTPAWWRGDGCPKAKHMQSGVHRTSLRDTVMFSLLTFCRWGNHKRFYREQPWNRWKNHFPDA